MVEQALDAGVMRFDTCARGREAVLPSVLLAAIGGAGGDQASDEGAVIAQSLSILTLASHAWHAAFACAQLHPGFHAAFSTHVIVRHNTLLSQDMATEAHLELHNLLVDG